MPVTWIVFSTCHTPMNLCHLVLRWNLALAVFAVGLLSAACTDTPLSLEGEGRDVSTIQMSANVSGTSISTLVVRVSAADIATPLVFNLEVANGTATGTLKVPAGSARLFEVKAYDTSGGITHEGSKTVNVARGSNPPLSIPLAPRPGEVPVEITMGDYSVVVNPASATLTIGSTQQLSATVTGPSVDPTQVRWATRNPSIATVSSTGLVTAVAAGDVQIVATYEGVGGSSAMRIASGNAATEFSGTSNPNGPWSSGWTATLGGRITLYSQSVVESIGSGYWISWRDPNNDLWRTPHFSKNTSGASFVGVAPGQLAMHSGCNAGEYSVLRWTAFADATYSISATFYAGDVGRTAAYVLRNGDAVNPLLSAPNTDVEPSYTRTITLSAGEWIDFVVGVADDGCSSDTTPIDVTVLRN